jgi:Ca2+-binding RTX toxin-like protein
MGMRIEFLGSDTNFFEALLSDNVTEGSTSSTLLTGFDPTTGYRVNIIGRGFAFDGEGFITGGFVTSITFIQNGVLQGRVSQLNWDIAANNALFESFEEPTKEEVLNILGIGNNIILDARSAGAPIDLVVNTNFNLIDTGDNLLSDVPYTIFGSRFNDLLAGSEGNDTVDGGAGQDTFFFGLDRADVTVTEVTGGFRVDGANGIDIIRNVELFDFNGAQLTTTTILDNPGLVIEGDGNSDFYLGSNAGDTISAGRGDDVIEARRGDDLLSGDGGNDTLRGGEGNDTLRGGREEDNISGDAGNDVIRGQRNGDTLDGGDGNDNVKGGGGNDLVIGGAGNDFLTGGTRRDTLEGGTGNDTLIGNSFDDLLDGGDGDDFLNAGGQNDTLIGGSGNDTLKSGGGSDTFVFDLGHEADLVLDLDLTRDTLEISLLLAAGRDAQALEDAAERVGNDVRLDFGGGDEILFQGLGSTDGLADVISIV